MSAAEELEVGCLQKDKRNTPTSTAACISLDAADSPGTRGVRHVDDMHAHLVRDVLQRFEVWSRHLKGRREEKGAQP